MAPRLAGHPKGGVGILNREDEVGGGVGAAPGRRRLSAGTGREGRWRVGARLAWACGCGGGGGRVELRGRGFAASCPARKLDVVGRSIEDALGSAASKTRGGVRVARAASDDGARLLCAWRTGPRGRRPSGKKAPRGIRFARKRRPLEFQSSTVWPVAPGDPHQCDAMPQSFTDEAEEKNDEGHQSPLTAASGRC